MLQAFMIRHKFIFLKGVLGFSHRWKSHKPIPFIRCFKCPDSTVSDLDAKLINAAELLFLFQKYLGKLEVHLLVAGSA